MEELYLLEDSRLKWSLMTFKETTPLGSLCKAKAELQEVLQDMKDPYEYVDFIMCLFDTAARLNIFAKDIVNSMFFETFPREPVQNHLMALDCVLKAIEIIIKKQESINELLFSTSLKHILIIANWNGITIDELIISYREKNDINQKCEWIKNPDNSYSRKK
jgi:hypothetical protein